MTTKKKLKIGFFIPYFVPAWRFGGPVKGTYELGRRLALRGHNVKIFCSDVSNIPKKRIKDQINFIEGMKIYYFRNLSNLLASKYKIFLPLKLKTQLKTEIKDLDLIHTHCLYDIGNIWIYRILKGVDKPFFISTRGVLSKYAQRHRKYIKIFINSIFFKILKNADLIFAQTPDEKIDCEKIGLKNIMILNNGIDLSNFKHLPSKYEFRKKYGINNDDKLILYLGRINKIKGLKLLVESFAGLKHLEKLKLVLIGPDDNYFPKLKKLIKKFKIKDKVLYLNGLYGKEKLEAYAACDIFCLPSVFDCCPNSMLEACASGLPIITTNTNGLSYLIKEGGGIIIPSQDHKSLKKAILYLIENPIKSNEVFKNVKDQVTHEFDWNRIVDKLEFHYHKILEERAENLKN